VAIIAAGGGTDLYCHSEPPLTSGKLCFIINFIGGHWGQNFYWGPRPPVAPSLNRPWRLLKHIEAVDCQWFWLQWGSARKFAIRFEL